MDSSKGLNHFWTNTFLDKYLFGFGQMKVILNRQNLFKKMKYEQNNFIAEFSDPLYEMGEIFQKREKWRNCS